MERDPAAALADLFRPFITKLSTEDQARIVDLVSETLGVIAADGRKRRPRRR